MKLQLNVRRFREASENLARSRRCEDGAVSQRCHWETGKAEIAGEEIRVRRTAGVQPIYTWLRTMARCEHVRIASQASFVFDHDLSALDRFFSAKRSAARIFVSG